MKLYTYIFPLDCDWLLIKRPRPMVDCHHRAMMSLLHVAEVKDKSLNASLHLSLRQHLSPAHLLLSGRGLLQSFLLVGVHVVLIVRDRIGSQFEPMDGQ